MEHVPRKLKKQMIGKRKSRSEIRKMLKAVVVVRRAFQTGENLILPDAFCPKCGCQAFTLSGNRVEYPERWETGYCLRCGASVLESDNSPYIHVLEELIPQKQWVSREQALILGLIPEAV